MMASQLNKSELDQFFVDVGCRLEKAEREQNWIDRQEATHFNVFDLIDPDENQLSDILADLLNPKGKHGQEDTFLNLLLSRLKVNEKDIQTKNATVQREAPTYTIQNNLRRLDILVETSVILVIENKLDSPEQPNQIKEYLEYLKHRTKDQTLPTALIYLTPDGRSPNSLKEIKPYPKNLHCWNYHKELRNWLVECQQQCAALKICYFLANFIDYIDTAMNRKPINQPEEETYEG